MPPPRPPTLWDGGPSPQIASVCRQPLSDRLRPLHYCNTAPQAFMLSHVYPLPGIHFLAGNRVSCSWRNCLILIADGQPMSQQHNQTAASA